MINVHFPVYSCSCFFFFFNDTATTEIYTLSLHDALPIFAWQRQQYGVDRALQRLQHRSQDRKSTRLNSSHANISYAVFCLKKKKNIKEKSSKHPNTHKADTQNQSDDKP